MFLQETRFARSQRLFTLALALSCAALASDLAIQDWWQPQVWYVLGLAAAAMLLLEYRAGQIRPLAEALSAAQALSTKRWLLLCVLFSALGQLCIATAILQGPAAQIDGLVTTGAILQTLAVVWADSGKLIPWAHRRWRQG